MKVYITKYALTKGILEKEGTQSDRDPTFVRIGSLEVYYRPEWHESLHNARMQAEIMQKRKIASLEKEISKIKALSF